VGTGIAWRRSGSVLTPRAALGYPPRRGRMTRLRSTFVPLRARAAAVREAVAGNGWRGAFVFG